MCCVQKIHSIERYGYSIMKKLKLWLVLVAAVASLTACNGQEPLKSPIILEPDPIILDENNDKNDNASDADIPDNSTLEEDDTLPPKEGMVRSRLTNEWVDKDIANTRPIAVMVPNEAAAIPHYNLSEASVIYEANVEGRMTRMLAIYDNWQDLDKIGNVRSLRSYYAYWSFEWDAFIVHFGGPFYINDLLAQPDTQNINGNSGDDKAFFRSTDRNAPHNAYATGDGIREVINRKGYSLSYRGLADDNHFRFTSKAEPNTLEQYGNAESATYIDMSGCYPLTRCYFEYNEEDGLYYRSQHLSGAQDSAHMDDATGEQLKFKNVLVQNTKQEDLGDGYLVLQCHDTTRDGWYFTNGKGIHVTWEKTSDYGATRYYDDNGDEIVLNTGKTMICIVEDGDNFTFR